MDSLMELDERRKNVNARLKEILARAGSACRKAEDTKVQTREVLQIIHQKPPVVFVQVIEGQVQVKQVTHDQPSSWRSAIDFPAR